MSTRAHISQREAHRMRQEIMRLRVTESDMDRIVEHHPVWGCVVETVQLQVMHAIWRCGFRVEIRETCNKITLWAVRRKGDR